MIAVPGLPPLPSPAPVSSFSTRYRVSECTNSRPTSLFLPHPSGQATRCLGLSSEEEEEGAEDRISHFAQQPEVSRTQVCTLFDSNMEYDLGDWTEVTFLCDEGWK